MAIEKTVDLKTGPIQNGTELGAPGEEEYVWVTCDLHFFGLFHLKAIWFEAEVQSLRRRRTDS